MKGLAYKTVWVEYPDIGPLYKKLGMKETHTRENGEPLYSLPAIHDPKTGKSVPDSLQIVEYLDETYPGNGPILMPKGTHAFYQAFLAALDTVLSPNYWNIVMDLQFAVLNPPSQEWWNKVKVWEKGVDQKLGFEDTEKSFKVIEKWYKPGEKYIGGNEIVLADLHTAGLLVWIRALWGKDSPEWANVLTWNNGRWSHLLDNLSKYEQVL